jgi:hypothetical protein
VKRRVDLVAQLIALGVRECVVERAQHHAQRTFFCVGAIPSRRTAAAGSASYAVSERTSIASTSSLRSPSAAHRLSELLGVDVAATTSDMSRCTAGIADTGRYAVRSSI